MDNLWSVSSLLQDTKYKYNKVKSFSLKKLKAKLKETFEIYCFKINIRMDK